MTKMQYSTMQIFHIQRDANFVLYFRQRESFMFKNKKYFSTIRKER